MASSEQATIGRDAQDLQARPFFLNLGPSHHTVRLPKPTVAIRDTSRTVDQQCKCPARGTSQQILPCAHPHTMQAKGKIEHASAIQVHRHIT